MRNMRRRWRWRMAGKKGYVLVRTSTVWTLKGENGTLPDETEERSPNRSPSWQAAVQRWSGNRPDRVRS